MAEFVFTREKSVEVGEKVNIQNDRQNPFELIIEVIADGDNKKVAFNQDGEYLVSVFGGNVSVTTLKHSK